MHKTHLKILLSLILIIQLLHSQEYYYKNNHKIVLEKVLEQNETNSIDITYYTTPDGITLGVTDKIMIKTTDQAFLEAYVREHNLTIEKQLSSTLYLLKVRDKSTTLHVANALHEHEHVIYAHPDFIRKRLLR